MNQIEREIYVTQKRLNVCFDITSGSDLLPIKLKVMDYLMPTDAIATAYVLGIKNKLRKIVCSINENEILFTPSKGFFDEGPNSLQIRITCNSKDLVSFEIAVRCQRSIINDNATETEDNPSLTTQLLSEVGVLSARLDEALSIPEGGTTADAALNDIKVGYDGTVYDTPGNAVREQVEEAHERIDANSIISTAQGETILVTDSAKVPPENIKLFGKTTQVSTEGNQLLSIPDKVENRNGLTFDVKNGVCTIKGTTTADTLCWFLGGYDNSNTIFTLPPGNYYIKDCRIWSFDGTTRVNKTGALTLTENFNVTGVYTETYTSGTVVNTTIYPMINKGSTALPFEPYTGGKPSPSIDYPQELNSCGNDEKIRLDIFGSNLLNIVNFNKLYNGINIIYDNGFVRFSGTIDNSIPNRVFAEEMIHLNPGIYTFSTDNNKITCDFRVVTKDGKSLYPDSTYQVDGTETFVFVRWILANSNNLSQGTIIEETSAKCMLNIGSVPFSWMEYIPKQPFTALTPNGLPGIPVSDTSIANYIDETGQAWVADYVDLERGKLVHMVAQEIIEGTPVFSETNVSGRFVWTRALTKTYKNADEYALSNFAKYNYWGVPNQTGDVFAVHGAYGNKSLYYAPSAQMTADEVNTKFAEMIASDNPPVIVGQLAEPIETDLTPEELAQYNALYMNYPNTTITNNSGAYMEVEYVASPREYIANLEKKHDNDIQQLKTAIIALGGTI